MLYSSLCWVLQDVSQTVLSVTCCIPALAKCGMLYPRLCWVWQAVSQPVWLWQACVDKRSKTSHQQERKFSISTPGFQLIQQPFHLNVCLPAEVCLIQRYWWSCPPGWPNPQHKCQYLPDLHWSDTAMLWQALNGCDMTLSISITCQHIVSSLVRRPHIVIKLGMISRIQFICQNNNFK